MSLLAVLQIVFCPVLLFLRQHSCYGIPATDDKSKYKKVSWTFLMINVSGISASFDRRIMCQRNLLWWSSIFRLTGLTQVFSSRRTSSSRTATPSGWRSSRPGRSTTTTQPSTSLTRSGIYEIFLFIYLKSNLYMKTRQFSWLEVKVEPLQFSYLTIKLCISDQVLQTFSTSSGVTRLEIEVSFNRF